MKRFMVVLAAAIVIAIAFLALFPVGQHADRSFDTSVARPAYAERHPVVLFDEGHYNAHSIGGGYKPFAKLLEHDGYEVRRNEKPFTRESLRDVAVLAIVNASGGSNPKLFGFNLVPLRKGRRDAPAFITSEVDAIRSWVNDGGSLLLVADHYPFGAASSSLAAAFGVTMHCGFTEVPEAFSAPEDRGTIRFTRANALLGSHEITSGVEQVLSFTGQSLDSSVGTPLLKLPHDSIEYVPPPPDFAKSKAGSAQGFAIEYGRGRVVILGEAAMLTAQVNEGKKFGMNVGGPGNRQFALNVLHWLSHFTRLRNS